MSDPRQSGQQSENAESSFGEREPELYSPEDLERINKVLKQPNFASERAPFRMRYVLAILFGTGGTLALLAWLAANWSL
ncbi:MAG: hypothetical protein ISN29_03390 [Gammaproteobacteria bacterium AqS3]|nr:hypothetical protein [Gammaproteobacteria bacterium AqS3]